MEGERNRLEALLYAAAKNRQHRPPHVWHQLFQVVQRWLLLQELLVERQREVELHDGQVVDGQAADEPDEVKQVNVLESLEGRGVWRSPSVFCQH